MALRVLVTRPEGEAASWLQGLQAAGFVAETLPLIAVGPVADTAALRQAWATWADWQAVMFVSVPAVRHFFAQRPPRVDLSTTPCWAPGPGTRKALRAEGVPESALRSPDPRRVNSIRRPCGRKWALPCKPLAPCSLCAGRTTKPSPTLRVKGGIG